MSLAETDIAVPDYLDDSFDSAVHLVYHERIAWERQERVLAGYGEGGTIKAGLLKSGVHRRTVEDWRKADYLGFARRFEAAHRVFCDEIESAMWTHASQLRPGQNPTMLIALANANMPEKYRGTAPVVNIDARSISAELAQIGRALLPATAPALPPAQQEETHPPKA